jgi:hypothetical protein
LLAVVAVNLEPVELVEFAGFVVLEAGAVVGYVLHHVYWRSVHGVHHS